MSKRITMILFAALVVVAVSAMSLSMTSAIDFGTGWVVQWYNGTNFNTPVGGQQLIGQINIPTKSNPPATGVNADNFSARFTSTQNFTTPGTYQFIAVVDDGARVIIDGITVLDQLHTVNAVQTYQFNQTMTAGSHAMEVDFVNYNHPYTIQFQWILVSAGTAGPSPTVGPSPTPGPTSTPLPTALPAIPAGALTATVIRAQVLVVHSAPFLGATHIGRILRGQTYAVVGRDEHAYWFLLQLSGFQGWVWGYYVYIDGNEFNAPVVSPFVLQGAPASLTGVVAQTHATLKLRAAATVNSAQIGRIPWGDVLAVVGRTRYNDWYQVEWRNTIGWVFAPYVSILQGDINTVPIVQ
jgi:uncharacterized protein YgiM (DUF1202 family)